MTTAVSQAHAPLSVAQEALWYSSVLTPREISYNEAISFRKRGSFDAEAFRRAFDEIVRRHPAWRTTFEAADGDPIQVVCPATAFDLPVRDLSHLTAERAERRAVRVVADVARVPYDLQRGPLVRPRLFRFPGDEHRLYLAMHHLIFDGVSVTRVVLPELVVLYDAFRAGLPSPLPEPKTRYVDYARWEQNWIDQPRPERRLKRWREHLTPLPVLTLPLDHPRPPATRSRGGTIGLSLAAELVQRLRAVGLDIGATLFQVLATGWAVLLGRYAGQDDVIFATAADLRQRPEFEAIVGYSLTTLVLQLDLSGDPCFTEAVIRLRNELLDGLDNVLPFERLVRGLPGGGQAGGNPIYQTMIVLEPATESPDPMWSIHQIDPPLADAVGCAKLDLELQLDERPDGHVVGQLIYDRELFETATANAMTQHWLRLLGAVAADPGSRISHLPVLTRADEHRQLIEWNATTAERPCEAIHDLIRARASEHPGAPAVSAGEQTVSYGELELTAARIADRLLAAGVRAGDVVAVCSEPSIELVAAALGALKAGAADLLLNPRLPRDELASMVSDSGAMMILAPAAHAGTFATTAATVVELGAADEGGRPAGSEPIDADAICSLQYASRPLRGVRISHGSVVNLARAISGDLGIGPTATVAALPSTVFEAPVMELWMPLIAGAKIVLVPAEVASEGARLSRLISAEQVTFLHAAASTWQTLIDSGLRPTRSLRGLSGGGELSPELAAAILKRCRVLWNAYGVPETTACSTLALIEQSATVTIGRPIANTRVYVVDGHDQPVPVGVTGQLLVAGDGVARGYVNHAQLNRRAFVEDPFGPGRAYRTGVRARWLADGELQLAPAAVAGA